MRRRIGNIFWEFYMIRLSKSHSFAWYTWPSSKKFRAFDGWKEYPIEGIVAMLRLGHKYQFDKLKKIAKQRMTQVFPTRNPKWKVTKMFYSVGGWTNEDLQLLDSGLAYDTLTLFRETGLHCVLPAAYLFCVWNSDDLVSTVHWNLNVVAFWKELE